MSRADRARRQQLADERDRAAHERPNEPPGTFGPDDSWEGRCAGNRTGHHGWPSGKERGLWQCGSCGRWLNPPVRTLRCDHKFIDSQMCVKCGWVPS